tara:strand:- start:3002 stop:3277 length:276 start_codon:yes stop_codon:yes gene_type:complete
MSDFTANDKSHFKISLPMLIQAVGGVALIAAMWTSTQADLHALQKDVGQLQDQVKSLLELQDKPIPSDIRQDTRLDYFEKQIDRINGLFYR